MTVTTTHQTASAVIPSQTASVILSLLNFDFNTDFDVGDEKGILYFTGLQIQLRISNLEQKPMVVAHSL